MKNFLHMTVLTCAFAASILLGYHLSGKISTPYQSDQGVRIFNLYSDTFVGELLYVPVKTEYDKERILALRKKTINEVETIVLYTNKGKYMVALTPTVALLVDQDNLHIFRTDVNSQSLLNQKNGNTIGIIRNNNIVTNILTESTFANIL